MGWIYLILAILFEVAGTTFMKISDGFSKTMPSVAMAVFYLLSLTMLTFALKKFEVSTAYAIWSGLGTTLIAIVGIILFKEEINFVKIASILLIVVGVVGLQLSTKHL